MKGVFPYLHGLLHIQTAGDLLVHPPPPRVSLPPHAAFASFGMRHPPLRRLLERVEDHLARRALQVPRGAVQRLGRQLKELLVLGAAASAPASARGAMRMERPERGGVGLRKGLQPSTADYGV